MMYVYITGRIKNKKKVEAFAYNTLSDLLPRIKRDIFIDIDVVTKCDDGISAFCCGDKNEIQIELARKCEDIKFSLDEMIKHLAHELVHAKQFIKGELHPSLRNWKNKNYSKVPYCKTPWEKEAYSLEEELVNKHWK